MGFLDIIDPAIDSIKRLLNLEKVQASSATKDPGEDEQSGGFSTDYVNDSINESGSGFDLDQFIRQKLSLDPSKLDVRFESSRTTAAHIWRSSEDKNATAARNAPAS